MIVRTLLATAALAAIFGPIPAHAQDSAGMIVCEKDVGRTLKYLNTNRAQLSEQAIQDAEERLRLARAQCNTSPQQGSNTVAQLQRELGAATTQTAQPPPEGQSPSEQYR